MSKFALALIRCYQKYLSWVWGPRVCRFQPSCSQYTYQSISKYGILRGSYLGLGQLLRCHPFAF